MTKKNLNSKKKNRGNKGGLSASTPLASNSADSSTAITEETTPSDTRQSNQVTIPTAGEVRDDVDRISELELGLKMCILSLLPTRCVVATSVLSRAWKYVWRNLPELDFNDLPASIGKQQEIIFTKAQYASFAKYVNRVLFLHNPQWLHGLHIVMYDCFQASHIEEWMMFIATLNIEGISCISHKNLFIEVPPCLFLQKYQLVALRLRGFRLDLPLPPFYLPCLRYFSLSRAVLCDIVTGNPWTRLISNCPVLECLEIEHCDEGLEKFSVSSSSIKVLKFVSKTDKPIEIFIETPNLEFLHLSLGIKLVELNNLASLDRAILSISASGITWIKLLHRICCTKALELYWILLDGLTTSMKLPFFENLTHMEIGFTSWSVVLQIIRHAPKLASFTIRKTMFDWPDKKPRIENIPLKRIEYYGFYGEQGFKVLGYFLRHIPLLKKVILYACSSLDSATLKEILKLNRASAHCRIMVVKEGYYNNSKDKDNDSESEDSVCSDDESERAVDIGNDVDRESEIAVVSDSSANQQ